MLIFLVEIIVVKNIGDLKSVWGIVEEIKSKINFWLSVLSSWSSLAEYNWRDKSGSTAFTMADVIKLISFKTNGKKCITNVFYNN